MRHIGRGLLSFLFGFPGLWLLSRSSSLIWHLALQKTFFFFISSVFSSLLSLTQCKTRQFLRESCSKFSMSGRKALCLREAFELINLFIFFLNFFFKISKLCYKPWHKFKWFSHFNLGFICFFVGKWKTPLLGSLYFLNNLQSNFANSGEFKPSEEISFVRKLRLSLSMSFFEYSPFLNLWKRSRIWIPKKNPF